MRDLLLTGYMAALLIGSSIPGSITHSRDDSHLFWRLLPVLQNLLHIPAYGVLAALWIRALRAHGLTAQRSLLIAVVAATGYGGAMEIYQAWIPHRFASAGDVLLNVVGVLFTVWLYRRSPRLRTP